VSTLNSPFVGIDVGKSQLDAAIHEDPKNFPFPHTSEGLANLLAWIQDLSPTLIAVEATGGYEHTLVRLLCQAGF